MSLLEFQNATTHNTNEITHTIAMQLRPIHELKSTSMSAHHELSGVINIRLYCHSCHYPILGLGGGSDNSQRQKSLSQITQITPVFINVRYDITQPGEEDDRDDQINLISSENTEETNSSNDYHSDGSKDKGTTKRGEKKQKHSHHLQVFCPQCHQILGLRENSGRRRGSRRSSSSASYVVTSTASSAGCENTSSANNCEQSNVNTEQQQETRTVHVKLFRCNTLRHPSVASEKTPLVDWSGETTIRE